MKELTELIEAFIKLYNVVGPVWSGIGIFVIFVVPHIKEYFDDKKEEARKREIINEKEAQIQRLADENRIYRNYFFKLHGLTEEQIMQVNRPSTTPPKPITSPPPAKKGRRK